MRKIYLVQISGGQYEDAYDNEVFATFDKKGAMKWVKRFDSIIEKRRDYFKQRGEQEECSFWESFIVWDNPCARFIEVEVRGKN